MVRGGEGECILETVFKGNASNVNENKLLSFQFYGQRKREFKCLFSLDATD